MQVLTPLIDDQVSNRAAAPQLRDRTFGPEATPAPADLAPRAKFQYITDNHDRWTLWLLRNLPVIGSCISMI